MIDMLNKPCRVCDIGHYIEMYSNDDRDGTLHCKVCSDKINRYVGEEMKTIIAGSRDITDYAIVCTAGYYSGIGITEVVSGGVRGVDKLGEQYAKDYELRLKVFPADWNKYGNRAGPIRNEQMGDYADALIAVWDGKSHGTKHMIEYAKKKGLLVYVHIVHPKDHVPELKGIEKFLQ